MFLAWHLSYLYLNVHLCAIYPNSSVIISFIYLKKTTQASKQTKI